MTESIAGRPRFIIECIYYVAAIFFFLYLFVYLWTSEGGPTLLAMTLVPVTYVLFVLNGLRENDLYPGLPHAANYVIAAIYIALRSRSRCTCTLSTTTSAPCAPATGIPTISSWAV